MILQIKDDFDLDRIADSGQCFRWEKMNAATAREASQASYAGSYPGSCQASKPASCQASDPVSYRILAGADSLYITAFGEGRFEADCTEEEYDSFWRDYFDLSESYAGIRSRIDPEQDPFLHAASEHEKGIRILRQDPWEMLISFIISQNKNIPAIRRSIALLAETCGRKKTDRKGQTYYAFPEPEDVAALGENDLKQCSLGYRCKYVHAAAQAVLNGDIDLGRLRDADEESTMAALTGLFGVGVKVASCISLFGLHHTDAFPKDVWVKRILAQEYPEGYPYERYAPYNGVFQQYMFAYYRNGAGS